MVARIFRHPWGWTSIAPILCAIHCLVAPLLVATAPAFAPGEAAEWALLGITVVLVGITGAAALRGHRQAAPFVLILVGLLAWTGSLLHLFAPVPEEFTTVIASLGVAAGLLWNSRLHCATRDEGCSACEHEALEEAHAPLTTERPAPAKKTATA